jgi:hypothetical protein
MVHLTRPPRAIWVLAILLLCASSALADIVVNEIMYNPTADQGSDSYFEWVELWNTGDGAVDLSDWSLTDGEATFVIDSGTQVPSKHFVLIARRPDSLLLQPEYSDNLGDGDDVLLGPATFSLLNTSDEIVLVDPLGSTVDSVQYHDGPAGEWPVEPDGEGPSLELRNPDLNNNLGSSWEASTETYGSPGDTNSAFASVVEEERNGRRMHSDALTVTSGVSCGVFRVRLTLSQRSSVLLTLYDTSGKHVSEVFSGHLEAGAHELDFETRALAGTYVLHCELGDRRTATKVVVLN